MASTLTLTAHAQEGYVDSLPTTSIQFEEELYDFGGKKPGKVYSHVYRFKNTGDAPLLITSVKGSCGCTVTYFPKEPVFPGEESEIEVAFDSKGKLGPQSKRITISANTNPSQTFLTFRGNLYDNPFPEDPNTEQAEEQSHESAIRKINELHPKCFAIFPNPTNDLLQLELKEYIGQSAEVMILNEKGQSVHQSKVERISREATRFDVSTYPPGIYMVTIRILGEVPMTQCFIIAR